MRENDWIVAGLNNPNFSSNDFRNILGMTPENTLMLSASDYKKSQFIRDRFKNSDGTFNEAEFDNYYKQRLAEFNKFDENDLLVDNFEYSLADTRRKADSRTKSLNFTIQRVSNPNRETVGIAGLNTIGERRFTLAELAQTLPIFDTETGKYLNETPNDNAFVNNPFKWIGSFFEEPLVMAQYEENGTHIDPITGQEVQHRKGEYKLNGDGQYYYETLNGRSLVGKEILSNFDVFTIDGQGMNKYDFLDSDGLDKSVGGSIAKMAFTIAPMFIPYVGQYYSYALVARELSKSLPMMYGMATSLFGNDEDSQVINTIAAVGHRFSSGTSEYAKQHTFAFENFANLIADVATQWGQQKAIANTINNLRGSNAIMERASKEALLAYRMGAANVLNDVSMGRMTAQQGARYLGVKNLNWKEIEEVMMKGWDKTPLGQGAIKTYLKPAEQIARGRARLGADAALAYMAIVSNTDVYDTLLQYGAQKRDAALVALGSTLGMFGVDRYLHLGEAFFDGLTSETSLAMRGVFKNETKNWMSTLIDMNGGVKEAASRVSKNKAGELITKGINLGKKATNKYIEGLQHHSLGFFGKALTEGIEEVNEELVTDLAKQFYEIAGTFSPNFFNRSGISDVGAWDNALERYTMNFLGGFMGGGIFYGVDAVQNGNFTIDHSKDDLMYLVSNHRTSELLTELDKWHKKGKLGNTNLSATRTDVTEDGKKVYLTVQPGEESLNDFVYNRIKEEIIQLETILNSSGLNLGEDELYKQMVLGEDRFMALQSELQGASYSTNYLNEFRSMARKYIEAKAALEAARNSVDGTPGGAELTDSQQRDNILMNDPTRLRNIQNLELEFEKINQERIEFLQGNKSLEYTDKMLFAIDPNLREIFVSMTFEEYVKNNKHKNVGDLTESELKAYSEEYLEYKKSAQKLNLSQQYEIYKKIKEKVDPYIQEIADLGPNFIESNRALNQLFINGSILDKFEKAHDPDYKLDSESEEDFAFRNTPKEGETPEAFEQRKAERKLKVHLRIQESNDLLLQKINEILAKTNYLLDPVTQRYIHERVQIRKKDLFNGIVNSAVRIKLNISDDINIQNEILNTIKQLNQDLSNSKEISLKIESILKNNRRKFIERANVISAAVNYGFKSIFDAFNFSEFTEDAISIEAILSFLTQLETKIKNGDEETKKVFERLGRMDLYEKLANSENILDELLNTDKNDIGELDENTFLSLFFDSEDYDANELEISLNSVIDNVLNNKTSIIYKTIPQEDIDKKVDDDISLENDIYQNILSTAIEQIKNSSLITALDNIDSTIVKNSVVHNLLSNITKQVLGNDEDIENILNRLYEILQNIQQSSDFKIENADTNVLKQARYILRLAQGYLYAAAYNPNFERPVGHNAVLNEFAENHKDLFKDWNPLPQLQEDVAAMAINEINKYINEIDTLTAISERNRANKIKLLQEADARFTKTRKEFFLVVGKDLKFTINGNEIDLLEGQEDLNTDDNDIYIHGIENLFYINLHKLLKSGITFKQILENSKLLDKILNIKEAIRQKNNNLDNNITNLSDNDKFVYLMSVAGMSANEFLNFNKARIEKNQAEESKKLAPLTVQLYAERVAIAQIIHPELFEDALNYIQEVTGDMRPYLHRVTFIDGGAGVGKSSVVGKDVSKYVQSINPDAKIWLSAPEDTQLKTLFESVEAGEQFTKEDLFNKIMNPTLYTSIMTDVNNEKQTSKYYTKIDLPDGNTVYKLNASEIKFTETETPKLLIIDESTHYSSIEWQILSEWAKQRNVNILGLGDSNLNGFSNKIIRNLERELIFAIRPLKLAISLRDVNAQKQDNLLELTSIMNDLKNLEKDLPDYKAQIKLIKNRIRNILFKVYNLEEINGDLIVNSLSPNIVQRMHGTIAYVGDTTSDTYKTLQEYKSDDSIIQSLTKTKIQGQEFDYIVIDQQWSLSENAHETKDLLFLKDLYTLISRGKIASVIIDNGLTKIIKPNKEEFNKALAPNLQEAIPLFVKSELDKLNKLNLLNLLEFEKQILDAALSSEPAPKEDTTPKPEESDETESEEETIPPLPELEPKTETEPETESEPVPITSESESEELDESDNEPEEEETIDESEYEDRDYLKVEDTEQEDIDPVKDREIINSIWGTDEELDTCEESEDALNEETPMRVYSSAHLSGLKQIKGNRLGDNNENYWLSPENLFKEKSDYDKSLDFDNYIYLAIATKPLNSETLENLEFNIKDAILINKENSDVILNEKDVVLFKFSKSTFEESIESIQDELLKMGYIKNLIPLKFIDAIYTNEQLPKLKIKRDLQMFAESGIISEGSEKDELTLKLLALKSLILYKHSYDEAPNFITKVFTEDEFKNIKYKLVVRRKSDIDNFVGYTGLDLDKINEYNGFVYSVVAQIGDIEVTLGLLANPDNYAASEDQIRASIANSIKKLDLNDEFYDKKLDNLQKRDKGLKKHILDYKTLIDRLATNALKNGEYFEVLVDAQSSALSYIRRSFLGKPVTPKLVSSYLKGESDFRRSHPYLVISKPYVYLGKDVKGISESNRGKSIIFITADTLLSPDKLAYEYMESKNLTNLEENDAFHLHRATPRTRMIILDPRGLSFRDLAYVKFANLFKTELTINKKLVIKMYPFEEDYMGARMFTSLWNWRANLNKFIKKYTKFKEEKGYTDELLQLIALVADAIYRAEHGYELEGDSEILKLIGTTVTEKQINDLNKFNDSLSISVRQFRLGGSLKESGAYVRKLTNIKPNNLFYGDNTEPCGIYLTPSAAVKYYNLTQDLFSSVLDKIVKLEDENGNPWSPDKLITTKKSNGKGYQNSISRLARTAFSDKLITLTGGIEEEIVTDPITGEQHVELVLDENEYIFKMPSKKSYTYVPIALIKVFKKAYAYRNMLDIEEDFKDYIKIGDPDKGHGIIINDISNVLKHESMQYNEEEGKNTLLDYMLSLAFHGTTNMQDDFKATDAYFKKGFFSDPFSGESVILNVNGKAMFGELISNEALFEINCEVDMPVFDVFISQVSKTLDDMEKPKENLGNPALQTVLLNVEVLENLGLIYASDLEDYKDSSLDELKAIISEQVNKAILDNNKKKLGKTSLNDTLNLPYSYNDEEMTVQSLGDFILSLYVEGSSKLEYREENGIVNTYILSNGNEIPVTYKVEGEDSNKKVYIAFGETLLSIVKSNNGKLIITRTDVTSTKIDEVKELIKEWRNQSEIKDELDNHMLFTSFESELDGYNDISKISNVLVKMITNGDISDELKEAITKLNSEINRIKKC